MTKNEPNKRSAQQELKERAVKMLTPGNVNVESFTVAFTRDGMFLEIHARIDL